MYFIIYSMSVLYISYISFIIHIRHYMVDCTVKI